MAGYGAPANDINRDLGAIELGGAEAIQVDDDKLPRYIAGVLAVCQEVWLGRQIAE